MRHKQRPVKSSRHKSVTFIIDSHTSFGEHNNSAHNEASAHQQHHQHQQQPQFKLQPILPARPATQHRSNYYQQQSTNSNNNLQQQVGGQCRSARPATGASNRAIIATNDELPSLRKQFEHNDCRHMSDVMRLAFLENNDISIDDCSNVDFNSLSTASILQRNIQQQLLQQRRDQLQLRQQQQQHQQQQFQHQQQEFEEEELDDTNYDNIEDYEISDSRIFATATPTSSSAPTPTNRINLNCNAPKTVQQRPSGSGANQRHSSVDSAANRKRARDSVEFSNHVRVETIQNHVEGFFCDEPGCGKSFPSLRKLRHHKVVHSDDFPFVCEFKGCAKKFKRKFGIDLHSTTHFDLDPEMYSKTSNNSSLPFFGRRMQYSMCKPCGQKFKTVHEYQYHMLKHGKEPFKCPVKGCGQTFGIWKSFQKHRASHYFNYYCKMDPRCDHHTSNLQLLKLHIYCCHFRRKLPDNATLASKDPAEDESARDEQIDVVETEDQPKEQLHQHLQQTPLKQENHSDEDDSMEEEIETPKQTPLTPRRDSRLRKNPPRFSTFGHQDYASINNGSSFAKSLPSTPQSKRTRSTTKQQPQQQPQQQFDDDIVDDYGNDDDYGISDSGIFATATPTSSSSRNNIISTPKEVQRLSNCAGKKRKKEVAPRAVIQSPVKQEIVEKNYAEGFFCDEPGCGKSFPSLRKLRHHKVVHSDDFPFVCEFKGCAKKFKRKFGIDLHSTTHFDLDPEMYSKTSNNSSLPFFGRRMQYSMCKPCGQKFKTVHEYQYHMLKHGKEPFKCPVKGCGQTFGIWKSFQKHRASHYFNYYCKMDPRCDHHTSNLQLLKLHIYCCHFRRKLPDNATLASKDPAEDESARDEQIDVVETEDQPKEQLHQHLQQTPLKQENHSDEDDSMEEEIETPKQTPLNPRRDSRLRKNPPRFNKCCVRH